MRKKGFRVWGKLVIMQTFGFVECTHIPTTCPLEISQDNFLLLAVLFMKRTGCVRL